MRPNKTSKILAVSIVTTAVFGSGALAANLVTATSTVNVRSGADDSYSVVGVLNEGDTAVKLETIGDWTKIQTDSVEGYVNSSFLLVSTIESDEQTVEDAVSPEDAITTTMYCTVDELSVRADADSSSDSLGSLSYGESMEVVESVDGWSKIVYHDAYAYVITSYLSEENPADAEEETSTQPADSEDMETDAAETDVSADEEQDTASEPASIQSDTEEEPSSSDSANAADETDSTEAPADNSVDDSSEEQEAVAEEDTSADSDQAITATAENAVSYVVYSTSSSLNVRSGAGTSNSVIGSLTYGQSAIVVDSTSNWYKIEYNGGYGYIAIKHTSMNEPAASSSNTSASLSATTTTMYSTSDSLNVRSGPGRSYSVLGTLSFGKSVKVVGSTANWYKIQYSDGYAYVAKKYISESKPSSSSSSSKTMYCTVSALNVRSGPGTSYSVIGSLSTGDSATVVSTSDGWCKIKYGSGYGYVSASYMSSTSSSSSSSSSSSNSSTTSTKMYCTASALNVRSGAGTSYSIIGSLSYGDSVTTVSSSNGWYKIKYGSGYGYVSGSYLSSSNPSGSSSSSSSGSSSSNSITSVARSLLGCSYSYGATGPSSFDCSGFTQYVYAKCGISIPRVASSQYASSTHISKSSLKAGDLVFFTGSGSSEVSHVGIYLGDGDFIHAANSSSGVCISSLSENYYTKYYVGSGRY